LEKLSLFASMRLDGVSPYQCVPRKFQLVGRSWGGAACEPDSAGKMPTGPTAKMAVLRLGFIPKNCRAAIFAAVSFCLAARNGRLQFLLPERDAGGCRNTACRPPKGPGNTGHRPVWRRDLRSVFLKKRSR